MKFLKKIIKLILEKINYKIVKIDYGYSKLPFVEATDLEKELLLKSGKYSMTSLTRRWALIQAIKYVHTKKLEGDFVECGVWKGGNLIIFKSLNENLKINKKIYGYDTFEGMSQPSDHDIDYSGKPAKNEWEKNINKNLNYSFNCYAGIEEVNNNLKKNFKNIDDIILVKGKVENTLTKNENLPKKISILRLDTDWYESTKFGLEILYPKVSNGGILIIDDYGFWKGAQKAVDEYFKDQHVWMHYVDYSCRLIIK